MTRIVISKSKNIVEYHKPDGSVMEIKNLPVNASKKAIINRLKALGLRWR